MPTRILLPDFAEPAEPAAREDAASAGTAISQHELRRFLLGELAPALRGQIEGDASLQERLQTLAAEQRAEEAAFRLEVPLPRFLADHERRTSTGGARLWARLSSMRFATGAGALTAAACALFVLVRAPVDDDPIRSKGGRVGFLVRESAGARFGVDGEQLARGEQIQFAVRDDARRAAMVMVGVDGRGIVTVYAAERIDERVKGAAAPERTRLLPDSIVLDDATGAERFFVVYGDAELDQLQSDVLAAANELASSHASLANTERLRLPAHYSQSSVHIFKVPDR